MKTNKENILKIPDPRISAEEAASALRNAMSLLPPPGEPEIELIKMNPSLSWIQRIQLIHTIKTLEREQRS